LAEVGIQTPKIPTGNIDHLKRGAQAPEGKHDNFEKLKTAQPSTYKKAKKHAVKADGGGEPTAGAYSTSNIDPVVWFHPPSLTKRLPNEETRVPSDDPREKNDKYLDVTKRKPQEERMKLTKRQQIPGGMTQIPARTTLIAPHTATYLPSSLNAQRSRRRRNGGAFVAYGRQGCI